MPRRRLRSAECHAGVGRTPRVVWLMPAVYLVSALNPVALESGGVRYHVIGLAENLHRMGQHVFIVGAGPGADLPFATFLSVTKRYPLSQYEFFLALCRWAIRGRLEEGGIVHAHRPDDLYPITRFAPRTKTVCTLHGSPWTSIAARRPVGRVLYRHAERKALDASTRVISVSSRARDEYVKRYPEIQDKTSVIPVGIDLAAFSPGSRVEARAALGGSSRHLVLFAGRLEPEKRVDVLVDAANELGSLVTFLVAGAGRLGPVLRKRVGEGNIRFLGPIPHEKMPNLYAAADALVLPSAYEGLPTAAIEALACGTPLVATSVGDLHKLIIPGRTGFFFDGSPQDLTRVLSEHMKDFEGMREMCPSAARPYDWNRVAPQILQVYRSALEE
jgi:teichuronic acid biosynthesis glycosyltransferase TuaC